MPKTASTEFGFACDLYLQDTEPRGRETTLEQKRYYIESTLKPYFQGLLIGDIDAKAIIDWGTIYWSAAPPRASRTRQRT